MRRIRKKVYKPLKFHYSNGETKEEIEELTRKEWEALMELRRRGHDPEFWKEVYDEFFGEPFPYPEEKDVKKIKENY